MLRKTKEISSLLWGKITRKANRSTKAITLKGGKAKKKKSADGKMEWAPAGRVLDAPAWSVILKLDASGCR